MLMDAYIFANLNHRIPLQLAQLEVYSNDMAALAPAAQLHAASLLLQQGFYFTAIKVREH